MCFIATSRRGHLSFIMAIKVILPKSGMGIEEGTVARWLRHQGERVTKGEVIVEIETAKAVQELEAPVTGTLAQIYLSEGETAPVNTAIALIDEDHGRDGPTGG
jgi:pyruvate/2-oxoglutarate dehydrogenase complex dihydrolipoamide acyltransferase (E2) component